MAQGSALAQPSTEKKVQPIELAKIVIGTGHRPIDPQHIGVLLPSMDWLGLATPILVAEDASGVFTLIAGQHRVAAALLLGWTHIDAFVLDANDPKNRPLTISENL